MNDAASVPEQATSDAARPTGGLRLMSLIRIVGFMALSGVVLIVGVTGFIAWSERARLLHDAAIEAEGAASFLADHANRLFEVSDVALLSTKVAIGAQAWDEIAGSRELFDRLGAIARALPYIEDVWLNDARGILRATSFGFPAPFSDASDRETFKAAAMPDDGLHVGQRIVGRITKRATFLVGRRLEAADHGFRGMVSATADLAYFSDYWKGLRLAYDARIRLIRVPSLETLTAYPLADGDEAPGPPDQATAARLNATPPPLAVAMATQTRVGNFHRVGDLALFVEVAFSRAAIIGAWERRMGAIVPFAGAALLALIGVSALAFRQARREALAQAEAARARAELAEANARLETTVALRTAHLRETNEEVQQFAYLISHDLRAPLVNVLGFSRELESLRREIFAETPPDAARRAEIATDFDEALGFIRAGTTKMDRLLNHILKLSREGKRILAPETIDMTTLVRGLADAVRFQASEAHAAIEVADLPPLFADRFAVEQIFGNLLDNAVKYLDPARPGRIGVTARRSGDLVAFAVADNGRGIEAKDRERVFELFRRAGELDRPGDGIGLAHVRTLARTLGGHVDLRSEPGIGTVFTVTLPAAAA